MLGTEDYPGIMPITLKELFYKIEEYSQEREYKVKLWYLEIYNENLRDLLSNTEEYLDLREDPNKGIYIPNILEITVNSCKDIMHLLKRGNRNRTQESTMANEASSRSHAILQVQIEYKDKLSVLEGEIKIGKLSLIDLAGSERASATQNRGIRLIEGANINRSLLTLGNCINALCEVNEKGTKPHVPYRDSKLTRLLKDSLGGNSRTVMIANVSPYAGTFEDTYNTLKYANRAKNIKTHVQRNVLSVQHHIANYNNIINSLKNEIVELKTQLNKANQQNSINLNPQLLLQLENNNLNKDKDETSSKISSMISQAQYEKVMAEIKSHFEEEIIMKQKLLEQEQEISNLTEIVRNMGNNTISENEVVNIEATVNQEQSLNINHTIANTVDDDNSENKEEESEIKIRNKSKERENKLKAILTKLKKTHETNSIGLKEKFRKREAMMVNYEKMGIRDLQMDYLQSLLKIHNAKLVIIESKFRENIGKVMNFIKEEYIAELENQIKIRDRFLERKEMLISIKEDEDSKRLKTVDDLKKEFANRLPMISNRTNEKSSKNLKNPYLERNLPPISSNNNNNIPKEDAINIANVNSILSEVRMMSHHISKLEMNQVHNHIKQDRIKRKADFLNLKENQKEKLVQIRNFSNAIRVNNKINLVSNNNVINTSNQAANINNNSAHNISAHITTNNTYNTINRENDDKVRPPIPEKLHTILEHKEKIKKLKINEIQNFTPIRKINDSISDKSSSRSQRPSVENSRIYEVSSLQAPKHNNYSENPHNFHKHNVSDDEGLRTSKRNIYNLKEIRRLIKEESTSPKMMKDLNVQLARLDRITSSKRIEIPVIKQDNEPSSNNKKREGSLYNNDKAKLKNIKKIPFKI